MPESESPGLSAILEVLSYSPLREAWGNAVKELTTQGNPKPQPLPGGLERERHKPQQIPQGCTLTRERMWSVPAREGFLAGGQLTQGPFEWKQIQV